MNLINKVWRYLRPDLFHTINMKSKEIVLFVKNNNKIISSLKRTGQVHGRDTFKGLNRYEDVFRLDRYCI